MSISRLDFLGFDNIKKLAIRLEEFINNVKETSPVDSWKTYSFSVDENCEINFELANDLYNYIIIMEELLLAKNEMINCLLNH